MLYSILKQAIRWQGLFYRWTRYSPKILYRMVRPAILILVLYFDCLYTFYLTLSGIRVNLRNSYIFFQNDIICLFACRSNNSKPLEEELLGYLSLTGVVNGCSYNLQIAAD